MSGRGLGVAVAVVLLVFTAFASTLATGQNSPAIVVSPSTGPVGTNVSLSGSGFSPGSQVQVRISGAMNRTVSLVASSSGTISASGKASGSLAFTALDVRTGELSNLATFSLSSRNTTTTTTSTSSSSSTTSSTTSATATTSTVSTSSQGNASGLSYPSAAQELQDKGFIVMEFDMYFPSAKLPVIVDLIKGPTSCPCHLTSLSQVGSTVQAISAGQENVTMVPSAGYWEITVASTETMNTAWNGSPTVRPGDVYQVWEKNSSSPGFVDEKVAANFVGPDNVGLYAYGVATLLRAGVTYTGVAVYWRVTANSGYDPHPVAGWSRIWGIVPTPSFVLMVQTNVYTGGQYGGAYSQDLSEVAYPDGFVYPVTIRQSAMSCSGETISFTDPRTGALDAVSISFLPAPFSGCSNGVRLGEDPFVVTGTDYYGWVR